MASELIVMLTHNDLTVSNAYEIFEQCRASKARYWGFKEKPLPLEEMRRLYARMKACGKTTVMEVVAYTEEEGLEGARMAVGCGCDVLMGTSFHDSILDYCQHNGLAYMPFVGVVEGRPSILKGSIEGMVAEAQEYVRKGAYGIDLLAYRYVGDARKLIESVVNGVDAPVCVAGSIDGYDRLKEVKSVSPWGYTIGSAFFEHRFGEHFGEQVDKVVNYMH